MATDDVPRMGEALPVTGDWSALPGWLPVPGMGVLAVNSFLWKGREPMLVDTGIGALGDDLVAAIEREIDPADLRWIWLSHTDPDHVGNLARVLQRAPRAEVVTTFLGMGKLQLAGHDVSRVRLLEPGEALEAGGRRFLPVRPPYYDAPETTGFYEPVDGVLFAADSFGALLPAPAEAAAAIEPAALRDGLVGWAAIDAPWLGVVDRSALGRTLAAIDRLDPAVVLTGHLPVVRGRGDARALTRIVAESYGRGGAETADPLSFEHLLEELDGAAVH